LTRELYHLDASWRPQFPIGSGSYAAVDVHGDHVVIGQRNTSFVDPVLVFDRAGHFLHSFGHKEVGKGVHHGAANWGVHGINLHVSETSEEDTTVWVTDFLNHTVISFSMAGKLLSMVGNGASSDLDKFDSPADIAFHGSSAFVVDGDGGKNMRVSRWLLKDGQFERPVWALPQAPPEKRSVEVFDHPHSVCWHQSTGKIIVADRDNWRIVLMDPDTADITGNVTCNLDLGPGSTQGRPFGVRTWLQGSEDFLLVEVAGNDQVETHHQMFHVLDASGFAEGRCSVLQSIAIDPSKCHTPHMVGLDSVSGDVYLACNQQPNSNVVRLVRDAPSISI